MVDPIPGWMIFMAVVAFIVLIIALTFSNLGKNEKDKRRNKRRVPTTINLAGIGRGRRNNLPN
jgi:preprotein translocase subunit SecG